jgi:hypothetical protein
LSWIELNWIELNWIELKWNEMKWVSSFVACVMLLAVDAIIILWCIVTFVWWLMCWCADWFNVTTVLHVLYCLYFLLTIFVTIYTVYIYICFAKSDNYWLIQLLYCTRLVCSIHCCGRYWLYTTQRAITNQTHNHDKWR